jgi:hypothetical protein
MTIKPYYFYTKSDEYREYYTKHSEDGDSPILDYDQLIDTIVDLYDKIAKLETQINTEK